MTALFLLIFSSAYADTVLEQRTVGSKVFTLSFGSVTPPATIPETDMYGGTPITLSTELKNAPVMKGGKSFVLKSACSAHVRGFYAKIPTDQQVYYQAQNFTRDITYINDHPTIDLVTCKMETGEALYVDTNCNAQFFVITFKYGNGEKKYAVLYNGKPPRFNGNNFEIQ